MTVYPLKMKPYFRHGSETPWGGGKLRELFNKDIPDDMTGESLEISALPGRESVIVNGELSGKTLTEAADVMGAELLGEFKEFPLLLKLLDAKERLSVQVHPDDEYAARVEGKRGKTEAWYILNADPGAKLVFGVKAKSSEELRQIVASGHIEDTLNWIDVRPGDCLYIQSGTVHAIGGGIVLYEIQQSSDVTYRMWDWGRPREIHTQKALDVTRCRHSDAPGRAADDRGNGRRAHIADRRRLLQAHAPERDGTHAGRGRQLCAHHRARRGRDRIRRRQRAGS